jgi:hypothetical protein
MRSMIILLTMATTVLAVMMLPVRPAAEPLPALAAPVPLSAAQRPPERSVVGTLDRVDGAAIEFVVNSISGRQTFRLQPGATIRQGSKTIKPAELAAHKGERVKVRYRESGGVRQAEYVVLATPAPRPPKTHADARQDVEPDSHPR